MKQPLSIRIILPLAVLSLAALACGLASALPGAGSGASPGGELLVNAPGVAEITLTTPATGAGLKPLLAWEPLSGAVEYQVTVYTPAKQPYWAWSGAAASVYLGGGEAPPPEDAAGPVVSEGMYWAVLAFDAEGLIAGSSALAPISP